MYKADNRNYAPEQTQLGAPLWAGHVVMSPLNLQPLSVNQQMQLADTVFDSGSQDIKSILIDDRGVQDYMGLGFVMVHDGQPHNPEAAERFFERIVATTFAGLVGVSLRPSDYLFVEGYAASQQEVRLRHDSDTPPVNDVLYQVIDEPFRIEPQFGDATFHTLRDVYGDLEIDLAQMHITDLGDNQ